MFSEESLLPAILTSPVPNIHLEWKMFIYDLMPLFKNSIFGVLGSETSKKSEQNQAKIFYFKLSLQNLFFPYVKIKHGGLDWTNGNV